MGEWDGAFCHLDVPTIPTDTGMTSVGVPTGVWEGKINAGPRPVGIREDKGRAAWCGI